MAIETISTYKTSDGSTFDVLEEAKQHEKELSDSVKEFKSEINFKSTIDYIIARLQAEKYRLDFDPKKELSVKLYSYEIEHAYEGKYRGRISLIQNNSLSTIYGLALKETLENDYKIQIVEDQYSSERFPFIIFKISLDDFPRFNMLSKKEGI